MCAKLLLLPVELQRVNHTASTNAAHFTLGVFGPAYNRADMANLQPSSSHNVSQVDHIVDRVERLLLRHEELQRTNALLAQQLDTITQERDSLKSRLSAARSRVDALLERLPEVMGKAMGKESTSP